MPRCPWIFLSLIYSQNRHTRIKTTEYKVFLRGVSKHNIGSDFQCIQDWNGIIIVISIYMYGKEKRADTSMRNYTVFFNEKYAHTFSTHKMTDSNSFTKRATYIPQAT